MKHPQKVMVTTTFALALSLTFACSGGPPARKTIRNASATSSDINKSEDTAKDAAIKVDLNKVRVTSNKVLSSSAPDCSAGPTAAEGSLRLLTKVEYNNTLRDILAIKTDYASSFPAEQRIFGFKNNASINLISDSHMDAYLTSAKAVAKELIPANLQAVAGCAATDGESCAVTIIKNLGPKLWRKPLSADDSNRLLNLYKVGAVSGNEAGLQLLISGLLSSSHFLYRSELGNNGVLTAHETANALSYFFWASVPDDELRKLADSGELLNNDVQIAQAKRLLASPRSKSGLAEFADALLLYKGFLSVPKDAAKFPQFTNEIRDALSLETENTLDYWVRVKNIKFSEMFTADYSAGGAILANYYGATPMNQNNTQLLNFASTKRRGVLGMGSVLATLATGIETNPIKRGIFVREHLLCEIMPQPTGLDIKPVPVQQGLTTRERFAAHTADPSCKACHIRIDGVGFGMEDFDAIGMFRDNDSGKNLDASGQVYEIDGKTLDYTGTEGLSNILKDSETAKRCFVLQAFRESAGRFEAEGDVCAIRAIADQFVEKDLTLAEVLIQIITNKDLSKRKGL